jgi:membrane-bound metal-dependent hydrolase YbcI (DUF457 family)
VILYAGVRYGASAVLAKTSVHRGMFHSIPALLIAAEIAFVAYKSDVPAVKMLMAGGVALGFFSHLLLDEIYSVQFSGVRIRLKKSAGSALKFVGDKFLPNVVTYALLMLLTYATLVDVGLIRRPELQQRPLLRHATESVPQLD